MNEKPSRLKRYGWTAGLLAAGAVAGGLISAALPAAANSVTTAVETAAPSGTTQTPGDGGRADGPNPVRSDEKALSASDAEKARAAALKAVSGATIIRVETDADGATYEAHVTKSDGSRATVKFDKDFNVTSVDQGMGGGPAK